MMGDEEGLALDRMSGMSYNPLTGRWRLSNDTNVNYIASFTRTPVQKASAAPITPIMPEPVLAGVAL